ncbi:hypothetical protein [Agromyces sp. ZXT2-6]|uniref:hypothetical protein n=1 Tax=Agromyces sp. ZXT2-6 TaxID=3461153 RepID=UPI004054AA02
MHDHLDLDERIARLQRAAYGADVPDEEREAAASELAALRSPGGRSAAGRGGAGAPDAATADAPTDEPALGDVDSTTGTSELPGGRAAQTSLVAAATIAVLAGLAGLTAGWALGGVGSEADEARAVRASESEAWRIFELSPPHGDRVRYPMPPVDLNLDRDSRRLLAARWDGVRLMAVRTVDRRDGCLILISPAGSPAAACTEDGRFPIEGLVAETEDGGSGSYRATWDATGRISLDPPLLD